jgi:hypothetical protein
VLAVAATLAGVALQRAPAAPPRAFEVGIASNANARELAGAIGRLGAPIARVEFSIDSSPARLAPVIAAYARAGVRVLPLAGFYGRVPSPAAARNLATWAQTFGPGGSFWRHRAGGELAIEEIEFGNETDQAYQFRGCSYGCSAYVERARAYALALKAAQEAIDGPQGDPRVGLLGIAGGGSDSAAWVDGMFEAVPDLARRIAGWTAHPYGPRSSWQPLLDRVVRQTRARGAPATIPIYITELGLASDDGRCLSNNYGWNPCMTYGEAAASLRATLAEIRARYGERLRAIFLYQAVDQRLPRVDANREHYFGVLKANGAPKGAYTAAVKALLRSLH